MSTPRKPKMIGAHVPKPPRTSAGRLKPQLYPTAREFNAAYDSWVTQQGNAPLVFQKTFQ